MPAAAPKFGEIRRTGAAPPGNLLHRRRARPIPKLASQSRTSTCTQTTARLLAREKYSFVASRAGARRRPFSRTGVASSLRSIEATVMVRRCGALALHHSASVYRGENCCVLCAWV